MYGPGTARMKWNVMHPEFPENLEHEQTRGRKLHKESEIHRISCGDADAHDACPLGACSAFVKRGCCDAQVPVLGLKQKRFKFGWGGGGGRAFRPCRGPRRRGLLKLKNQNRLRQVPYIRPGERTTDELVDPLHLRMLSIPEHAALQVNIVQYCKVIKSLTADDWKAALQVWRHILHAGVRILA